MIIYPAMTLRHGKCVKLYQGDFNQETLYSSNPLKILRGFAEQGARWVHIIDLDGAKDPTCIQKPMMMSLAKAAKDLGLKLQAGGGIRNFDYMNELFEAGVNRALIGSLAIEKHELIAQFLEEFGADKMTLAFDIQYNDEQQACVSIAGWQELSEVKLNEVIRLYQPLGIKHILCTDVARDGTLFGPNVGLYRQLNLLYPDIAWQASGGISSLTHLQQLDDIDIAGSIISSAIYYNHFSLKEALLEAGATL